MEKLRSLPRSAAATAAVLFLAVAVCGAVAQSASPAAGAAQSGGLQIGGSLADGALLLQDTGVGASSPSLAGSSVLTLNFVNANRTFAKVEGSVVVNLLYGAYADGYAAAVAQAVSASTAPGLLSLLTTQGAAVTVNLQKLYLEVYTNAADFSMGREIINFGVGTLFSPIDAFSRPTLTDLNYARSGSDVFRVDVPFGDVSGAEGVTSLSNSLDTLVSAIKLYTNVHDFDVSAVGIYRGATGEVLAGADFKGDLVAGIYGEAVEHLFTNGSRQYFEGMAGADYSVADTFFATAEYYYNGNPAAPGSLTPAEIAAAEGLFLNQHYLYGNVRYLLNEIMNLQASVVYDISGSSFLATVQYDWNVVQNADLQLYGRYIYGDIQGGGGWSGPNLQYGFQVTVAF